MNGFSASETSTFSCLILEDDRAFATMAAQVVKGQGGDVALAASIAAAEELTLSGGFDLYLLDNHLPDGRGYDFFEQVTRRSPDAPIVMITGVPDLGEAVALTRNGLFDYLTKPIDATKLEACLARAKLRITAQRQAADRLGLESLGNSPAMREVERQIRQAARHLSSTVPFTGETGSGKEVAAHRLHHLSATHGNSPFIAVNCAAVPSDMFEAELFGAERGAYTGADKRRPGLAAAASGGTLFLDEIGEVPLGLQPKLLRLLEARQFRPLGSTEDQPFNGRFVAATNKSLKDEAAAGRFREDLLYRLDVFSVLLPPLRDRAEDIPSLAELLLNQLATRYKRTKPLLKPADLQLLLAHRWPGNVRELRNVLERSLLKTPEESRWLSLDLNAIHASAQRGTTVAATVAANLSAASAARQSAAASSAAPLPTGRTLTPIEEQEYRLIREALGATQGGIRRAAAKLGMSPQALLRRLEKWPELRENKTPDGAGAAAGSPAVPEAEHLKPAT